MLSLEFIIVVGLLFGLLLCCMVGAVLAPGHVDVTEADAQQSATVQHRAETHLK